MSALNNLIVKVGRSVGGVVGTLYQAGRDSVDTVIRNVIPSWHSSHSLSV
jgi:PTS system glucitol/sorbitol-specific IIC component